MIGSASTSRVNSVAMSSRRSAASVARDEAKESPALRLIIRGRAISPMRPGRMQLIMILTMME